jgi:hypothetical protein
MAVSSSKPAAGVRERDFSKLQLVCSVLTDLSPNNGTVFPGNRQIHDSGSDQIGISGFVLSFKLNRTINFLRGKQINLNRAY